MHRAGRSVSDTTLVDTHCHLVLLQEQGLLQPALEDAAAAGVTQMVTIGVNLDDSDRNRRIAEAHANVFFSVGWDPQQPASPDAAELQALEELLEHPRAVAVGEVGLDCFFRTGYHETPLEVQRRSFRLMLELAAAHDKPVVVHDRDAHQDVLDEISAIPGSRGVMHCFTADATHAARCLDAGYLISFSGIVTFPRAHDIQSAARLVRGDGYVIETDSPFLTPVPHRGTVNTPARVADTAASVARLRSETVEEVAAATTDNARRLFKLPALTTPNHS
jgi:TatD DNase family protein